MDGLTRSITPCILLLIGTTSAIMSILGAVCLPAAKIASVCPLDTTLSAPLLIVGIGILLPVIVALDAHVSDAKESQRDEELISLLDPTLKATTSMKSNAINCKRLRVYLYVSHFLSAWGDRMWQFAVPILFMEIFVDTLLPSAVFSLFTYTACVFAMPTVGKWVDRSNRLMLMSWSIVVENSFIVLSTGLMAAIMYLTNADGIHRPEWTMDLILLFGCVLLCSAFGEILNKAQTLAIERDWVVVVAKQLDTQGGLEGSGKKDNAFLSKFNTTLRRIDLCCKILSPSAFGLIMQYSGDNPTVRATLGAVVVGVWNLLSFPLELAMTRDLYFFVPGLARQPTNVIRGQSGGFVRHWGVYFRHPVFLLSFSFCALYMTVLDGGTLNTGYLKWRGISAGILGTSRGIGAFFGLIGTFVFPVLARYFKSVESVAVVSAWLFWFSLLPIVVAFLFTGESRVSDYSMIVAMIVSRSFLWCTDLAETQVMQERVEADVRGSINAMQTATSQVFFIVIQLVGVFCHNPAQFTYLVIFSIAAVLLSACGFSSWYLRFRKRTSTPTP